MNNQSRNLKTLNVVSSVLWRLQWNHETPNQSLNCGALGKRRRLWEMLQQSKGTHIKSWNNQLYEGALDGGWWSMQCHSYLMSLKILGIRSYSDDIRITFISESYSYHIIPKLKLLADMFFQKYPKPPKSSVPKPTWSQRAVANQSLGPRTAMISHLQHGPNSKGEKSGNLKPGMLTPSHPVNLEFVVLGEHQFLCLNTWNLAISFWSTTKLEFIILFDQSVFWPNLAWRLIFERKTKERGGTGKDGGKEQKGTERNKKEQKKKKTGLQSKAKARNLPNTKPNTDDILDPKRLGDWGGLKSHYTL